MYHHAFRCSSSDCCKCPASPDSSTNSTRSATGYGHGTLEAISSAVSVFNQLLQEVQDAYAGNQAVPLSDEDSYVNQEAAGDQNAILAELQEWLNWKSRHELENIDWRPEYFNVRVIYTASQNGLPKFRIEQRTLRRHDGADNVPGPSMNIEPLVGLRSLPKAPLENPEGYADWLRKLRSGENAQQVVSHLDTTNAINDNDPIASDSLKERRQRLLQLLDEYKAFFSWDDQKWKNNDRLTRQSSMLLEALRAYRPAITKLETQPPYSILIAMLSNKDIYGSNTDDEVEIAIVKALMAEAKATKLANRITMNKAKLHARYDAAKAMNYREECNRLRRLLDAHNEEVILWGCDRLEEDIQAAQQKLESEARTELQHLVSLQIAHELMFVDRLPPYSELFANCEEAEAELERALQKCLAATELQQEGQEKVLGRMLYVTEKMKRRTDKYERVGRERQLSPGVVLMRRDVDNAREVLKEHTPVVQQKLQSLGSSLEAVQVAAQRRLEAYSAVWAMFLHKGRDEAGEKGGNARIFSHVS